MKAVFVVLFVMAGSAYCRSIPAQPSDIEIETLSGNAPLLVRKARQFGNFVLIYKWKTNLEIWKFVGYGGYNNYDYNPYNDTPNNYDNNPFNDNARRTYNNFDFNPFNDSPNNYDGNPYNDSGIFGKK